MTPGRKFSITTSAVRSRRRNTSLPAALLRLMVTERLPAFWARKEAPISAVLERGIGAELAGEIARTGRLDLDDLGAQQCELIGPERPCQHIGEIEHANAAEKSAHAGHSTRMPASPTAIMMVQPVWVPMRSASCREITAVPPPGGNGTIGRIGSAGHA